MVDTCVHSTTTLFMKWSTLYNPQQLQDSSVAQPCHWTTSLTTQKTKQRVIIIKYTASVYMCDWLLTIHCRQPTISQPRQLPAILYITVTHYLKRIITAASASLYSHLCSFYLNTSCRVWYIYIPYTMFIIRIQGISRIFKCSCHL